MSFINALSPWGWFLMFAVPPAIILLYFLKLKRHPVEVPSTYLWSRTIEDLHVNSIWQRLRQSLLLFLQLLIILLAIIACIRPGCRGTELIGDRFIFLVDNSASMGATDVGPTRLDAAKKRILELIDQMESNDVAMIISFSDEPRIEQTFTYSRSLLRQKVNRIKPTNRRSDLREALRAASGLANPGRSSESGTNDVQVADPLPATLYIYSDGGFAAVPNFSLGYLEPVYVAMGEKKPDNVGIVSFSTERNPENPEQTQAFARIENSGPDPVSVDVALYLDGTLLDAANVSIPAASDDEDTDEAEGASQGEEETIGFLGAATGAAGVQFELEDPGDGVLKLEIQRDDNMAADNVAYSIISTPRRASVLVVTPSNDALTFAMSTLEAKKTAEVSFAQPDILQTQEHLDAAAAGTYDLIVYDQCVPKEMPQANTLLIGNVPPVEGWVAGKREPTPMIIDTDPAHPLTHLVQMGDVKWNLDGFSVEGPEGAVVLFDADIGPVFVIGGREGFEDAVLGIEIVGKDEKGNVGPKSEWPIRRSFPVFVMNTLRYLGGARAGYATSSVQPGTPIKIRPLIPVDTVRIESPSGLRSDVKREGQGTFVYTRTDELGVYSIREGRNRDTAQQFAVNLFDSRESDLRIRPAIKLGYEEVEGRSASEPSRKETWKWLLLLALAVLLFEWYVYNRRVYL